MIRKLIYKMRKRRFCKLNRWFCPDCIYHDFVFDEKMIFRGNKCRYPKYREGRTPMPHWKLIATDVRLSHQLPTYEEFTASVYECTNCHNKVNDRNGLPSVCPWCGGEMKGDNDGQRNEMPR